MCLHTEKKKESVSDGYRCLIENQKGWFKNAIMHKNTMAHVAFHKAESENL